jgi:hypothetical protein
MANDLLFKASIHLGASPQNKRSSLLYKIQTVGNRQQAPISNITRAKNAFLWREKHDKAFAALKHRFTTAPVLKLPDPTKPYIVKTDASMSGIGALLEHEEEDGWHPVAFTSRKLQPAEKNYPVHDLELMAIVYAFQEWRVYLYGVLLR